MTAATVVSDWIAEPSTQTPRTNPITVSRLASSEDSLVGDDSHLSIVTDANWGNAQSIGSASITGGESWNDWLLGVVANHRSSSHAELRDELEDSFQTTQIHWRGVDIDRQVFAGLSDRERDLIDQLLGIIKRISQANFVYVRGTSIERFTDNEDGSEEIVVTQHVSLPTGEALRYWDQLGAEVQKWIDALDPARRQIAIQRIGMHIDWDVN